MATSLVATGVQFPDSTIQTTAAVGGSGTVNFIASGSISAGQTVGLRSDGTVEAIFELTQAQTVGAETSAGTSTNTADLSSVYDPYTNKVICVYRNAQASNTVNAVVGTISGTTITFGSAQVIVATTLNTYPAATYDTVNQKLVVAYTAGGSGDNGYAVVCSISGTTITPGTPVLFSSGQVQYTSACFDPVNAKVVIAYKDGADTNKGKAVVGTVSGTSISFGTIATFETGTVGNVTIATAYEPTSGKVVIAYDFSSGFAIAGTVSGTSISFGTAFEFDTSAISNVSIAAIGDSKLLVAFARGATNAHVEVLTVSGTSISGGTSVIFNSASTGKISVTYEPLSQVSTVFFIDTASTSDGTYVTVTVSGTTPTVSAEVVFDTGTLTQLSAVYNAQTYSQAIFYVDTTVGTSLSSRVFLNAIDYTNATSFIGFSTQAVAYGATVTVTTLSGLNEDQSGLTTASEYYLNRDGSISTTPTGYGQVALAISATDILVFQKAQPGVPILLQEIDVTGSTTVTFTDFTDSVRTLAVDFNDVAFPSGQLSLQASVDNGVTFTALTYTYREVEFDSVYAIVSASGAANARIVTATTGIMGQINLESLESNPQYFGFIGNGAPYGVSVAGSINSGGVRVNGLRFTSSAGAFTAGTVRLYGLV